MNNKLEILTNYIQGEFGYDGDIDPEVDLLKEQIMDSFSIVQLAMFIQERFEIELEAEDLTRENLAKISSMLRLIDQRSI